MIDVDSEDRSSVRERPNRNTYSSTAKAGENAKAKPLLRLKATKRALPAGDVIELTDSEDDNGRAGPSQGQGLRRAGPSRASVTRAGKSQAKKGGFVLPPQEKLPAPAAAPAPAVFLPLLTVPPHEGPLFLPDMFDEPIEFGFGQSALLKPPRPPVLEPAALFPQLALVPAAAAAHQASRNRPSPPGIGREQKQKQKRIIIPCQADKPAFDVYVAQVLEIIPDVLPAHVLTLIERHHPQFKNRVVEPVLHALFENPNYPKANVKGEGKRKRDGEDDQPARAIKPKLDYGDKTRRREGGLLYVTLALVSGTRPSARHVLRTERYKIFVTGSTQ